MVSKEVYELKRDGEADLKFKRERENGYTEMESSSLLKESETELANGSEDGMGLTGTSYL